MKNLFFLGVGFFLASVKLLQLAFLQKVLMYESCIFCCWVRVILAITGLCPDPGSSSVMHFVFVLMSLDTSRRSGVVIYYILAPRLKY